MAVSNQPLITDNEQKKTARLQTSPGKNRLRMKKLVIAKYATTA